MKTKLQQSLIGLCAAAVLLLGSAASALAWTASGVVVENQATLDYKVGGLDQTTILSDGDAATAGAQMTTFTVDKLVRPSVTLQSAAPVYVTPGATNQILEFLVTNDGNDPDGGTAKFQIRVATILDDIVLASASYDLDLDNDGSYDTTGVDLATATDVSIASEGSIKVRIHGNIPLAAINAQQSVYDVVAQAYANDGTTLLTAADNAAADTAGEDIVLADADGSATGATSDSGAQNATHAARGTLEVSSAKLTLTKTEAVVDDNLGTGTKFHVPGATVRYTITIENTGSQPATSVVVNDAIPAETTYVGNLTAVGSTAASFDGGTPGAIQVTYDTIAAGAPMVITFDVTIN